MIATYDRFEQQSPKILSNSWKKHLSHPHAFWWHRLWVSTSWKCKNESLFFRIPFFFLQANVRTPCIGWRRNSTATVLAWKYASTTMLKRMKTSNDEKCTFCNAQSENILHLLWRCDTVQQFSLLFKKFVNEECTNVTNMALREDFVLFDNMKDFESDEIFDFIILFAKFFLCKCKM